MTDAQSLHCPNCGAAATGHTGRCPYCRARLATISCPHCFALMFEGAAFCQACGAHSARATPEPATAACPGCKGAMARVTVGELALLECAACDGVWVDAADFERICADREAQAAVLTRWSGPQAVPTTRVRYRPCIKCAKMMNRMNFGRLSGTIIDLCRGHGTFLDAGELHSVVTFIKEGGLDRARQRERDDIEEERQRLSMLKAQIDASERKSTRDWEHRSISLLDVRRLLKGEE